MTGPNPPRTISFHVSGNTISNNNEVEHVVPGDTIRFRSNEAVYVTFNSGEWPFTAPAPGNNEIAVTEGNGPYGAGPYTVADGPQTANHYGVSLTAGGAAKATGTVDIDPGRR